jgi:hypothetical protein
MAVGERRYVCAMTEQALKPKRACIFCSATSGLSREHLLPGWLKGVFPDVDLVTHYRVIGRSEHDRREWDARPFRERVRVVCQRCNNVWMSQLEDAVKPIMIPMLKHVPCVIDRRAQELLATWALKTCLVFQASQTGAPPIAPRIHYTHVAREHTPPSQVSIWLTSHYRARFDGINSVYVQRPLGLRSSDARFAPKDDVAYLCFLAVSWVGFVIGGHAYATDSHIVYDGQLGDALLQVWPVGPDPIHWPPRTMMDQDLVEALALPEEGLSLDLRPSEQRRLV